MGRNLSFAEILNSHLEEIPPEEDQQTLSNPTSVGHWTFNTLPLCPKKTWDKSRSTTLLAYRRNQKKIYKIKKVHPVTLKTVAAEEPASCILPIWNAQKLERPIQELLKQYIEHGALISWEAFTTAELKKEYRRLLKALHPDLAKTTENNTDKLNQVIKIYRQLAQAFHKLELESNSSTINL